MKKVKRNEAKKNLFKNRYGMSRSEWAKKKRELRKAGKGIEIDQIRRKRAV